MTWAISWHGKRWTEADLTVGHIAVICGSQGEDRWEYVNPWGGPMRLMGVLAALIAVDEQRPVNDVLAELAQVSAAEFLGALSEAPDEEEDDEAVAGEPVPVLDVDELAVM